MYGLKIDEGGEGATPPALILVTELGYLELVQQFEDRRKLIAGLAGELATEWLINGGRIGFGRVAATEEISEKETSLMLRLPSKDLEHEAKHQEITNIAATLSVVTGVLNDFYDNNHSRLPRPQIILKTVVSAKSVDYYSYYMNAKPAPKLIKNINDLNEKELYELKRQTERVIVLFADHLLTRTSPNTVHAKLGNNPGTVLVDWSSGSCGLSGSGRGNELVGYNVDTAAQQIMLIGGLAAIATYTTR